MEKTVFEVSAIDGEIKSVKAYQPELRDDEIVLPVEFVKSDGETVTLGFTLDKEHLRELFESLDYPEIVLDKR